MTSFFHVVAFDLSYARDYCFLIYSCDELKNALKTIFGCSKKINNKNNIKVLYQKTCYTFIEDIIIDTELKKYFLYMKITKTKLYKGNPLAPSATKPHNSKKLFPTTVPTLDIEVNFDISRIEAFMIFGMEILDWIRLDRMNNLVGKTVGTSRIIVFSYIDQIKDRIFEDEKGMITLLKKIDEEYFITITFATSEIITKLF
uniref:Uncharacterized protein n=1 Tax=Strongyloides venezuelensis TaxID=75913 RepID=A0A0K0G5T4_STRVS